jgi:hypothetical protein
METLRANSWAEAHLYLMVTPCPACKQGPWEVRPSEEPAEAVGAVRRVRANCRRCGCGREFVFRCPEPPGGQDPVGPSPASPIERISASSSPSEIIDVGQWLSLFHLMAESASRTADRARARRLTFRAAQCLDEALKFYSNEDELPPPSACFTPATRQALTEHAEKFARQRLRDMRAKLPDLRVMARRLARDAARRQAKRWWQFWK